MTKELLQRFQDRKECIQDIVLSGVRDALEYQRLVGEWQGLRTLDIFILNKREDTNG